MSDEQTRRVSSSVEAGYEDLTIDELARRYENHRASLRRLNRQVPVPWCDPHDAEWVQALDQCWRGRVRITECRLQDPPKVWRQGERESQTP
jgi:hypothetical protein